jgi:hypothetical protein
MVLNDAMISSSPFGIAGIFNNQGTLAKSFTPGTTTIAVPFRNNGAVKVNSGTLAFTNGVRGTGAYLLTSSSSVLNIGPDTNVLGKISGSGSVIFGATTSLTPLTTSPLLTRSREPPPCPATSSSSLLPTAAASQTVVP